MFLAAHAFAGLLIGLAFFWITGDRRAVPVCIAGSLLPDLIDKPLAFFLPALSCGRTVGHTLVLVLLVLALAIVLFQRYRTLLGLAFACSILSHQLCDTLWNTPRIWLFPFTGPFPVVEVPDFAGYYLWLQITTLSEWLFLAGGLLILGGFAGIFLLRSRICHAGAAVFGIMGIFLLVSGLAGTGGSVFAPSYDALTCALAGIVAFLGAAAFLLLAGQNTGQPHNEQ